MTNNKAQPAVIRILTSVRYFLESRFPSQLVSDSS